MAIDHKSLGKRGGLRTAATHDMRAVAAHARSKSPSSLDYWRAKVDAKGELDKSDRDARARAAMRLHFVDLARKRKAKQNGNGKAVKAGPEPTSTVADHRMQPDDLDP
jgi:hypothetical protein